MLFSGDDVLLSALRSSHTGGVSAVVRYVDGQIPLNVEGSGSVQFRASAEIQSSTEITVVGTGPSLVPRSPADPFGAAGQEVSLNRTVSVGGEEWTIPLGVFRVTRAADSFERFRGSTVVEWAVDVSLSDRFEQIKADDFIAVEGPKTGNTVWEEIQRLSPIPVQQSLGDAAVPRGTVYESRFDAVRVLMEILGGVPHLTREGVLTARVADAWLTSTQPVFDLPGVVEWSDEVTNDFYNQVQVTNPNNAGIVAYAVLDDPADPRSVSRAGGRTYKQSAPIYATVSSAQVAARTILQRVSRKRSNTVKVTCSPEALLLELGDVGWIRDPLRLRAVFGEVSALTVPLDATQPVVVELIVAMEIELSGDPDETVPFFAGYPSEATFPDVELYPSGGSA